MQNAKTNVNLKGFYRSVLALVVPMALQNLINVGVQSADVMMLGAVGEIPLSAASLAGQVQFVMTLIFFGLASGASVLTSQYWGKGDRRTIEKVVALTLRLSMLVSLLFFLAALLIPGQLMRIFSPDEAIIAEGIRYLRIVAFSYLCMGFTNLYLTILRSVERVVFSTVVYAISFVSNVGLNAVFIFGLLGAPAMGIAGAALATTVARVIEVVIVVGYALRNPDIKLRKKDFFSWDKVLFSDFMKYSLPTILNEMLWGLAMSTNAVIIGHMGASAVAANSVTSVVRQLATVVCFGLGNAAAVMLGKTIGGGEKEKAGIYAGRFMRLTGIAALGGSALILLIRPLVPHFMNLTPTATEYLSFLLLVLSVNILGAAFNTTLIVGVFRSGGDTRIGLIIDIAAMWCVTIPLAALAAFVFHWPVQVVFLILMSDELIKLVPALLRYKSRKWLRNVTRADLPADSD